MIVERLVHNQLYEYLEKNKFLSNRQFGFRKGRSTSHAITYLSDFIRQKMDSGQCTGAVFIDLKKAFDTVDHSVLLSKLPIYGINGNELNWFQDYLFNRQQFVEYLNTNSNYQHITCGVPQASILGPLLFLIHINDLTLNVSSCEILLYADDMVIFHSDKEFNKIEEMLNIELNIVGKWMSDNHMIINPKPGKTECMIFGTAQKLS